MPPNDLLQVQGGEKAFGSKLLFQSATFAISEGAHVGVIGPNGAGKTTLFRILTGHDSLDGGQVIRSRGLRLGYLPQHDEWRPDETVEEFLGREPKIPIWELKKLSRGLGLSSEHFEAKIQSLSGGYRMRVKLLSLIGQDPNLMLLDEPTNYLDLETLVVLENFLQNYDGAFLLISHDREFLRRTCSETLEIEGGEVTRYPGTIDDYFEMKALMRSQLEARAESLNEKRAAILEFVSRFGAKATKARQAQSRLKTLEKMETIDLKPLPVRAKIRIPEPPRTGRNTLTFRKTVLGYDHRPVISSFDLLIERKDHIVVVGLNGAGKSTLLKAISGQLAPLSGVVEFGHDVSIGYYSQHVAERLDLKKTVLESLESRAHASQTRQDVLDIAGSLLFSGDAVHKPISVLSGGERSRVALGQILLERSSCLVLDEPTNHLDFDTVEALTQALVDYDGTVIVVSHDRSFARRVGTKVLEINRGEITLHRGTYDEYVWRVQHDALERSGLRGASVAPSEASEAMSTTLSKDTKLSEVEVLSQNVRYRESKKAFDRELKQLTKGIEHLEKSISDITAKITLLGEQIKASSDESENLKAVEELNRLQIELHPKEEEWVMLCEKREEVEDAIRELMREHC